MDTKANGRSILRRSSVILQRRYSRSNDNSLEEFQAQQQVWNAAAATRRSSVQQISTDSPQPRRASIAVPFARRNSIAAAKSKGSFVGSLPKSSVQAPEKADQHQHDYKPNNLKGLPIDSLRDSQDMLSDLDISSNCSEVSELFDEVDCTDPCDWFLDEEMEDEPMFEILERPDLVSRMRETVENIASQLNVSPGDAVLVLQYFNWKTEDLLHDYFDKPDYYLSKSGVTDRTKSGNSLSSESGQCKVCLEDSPASEFYALGCAHSYCRDCWKEYLQGFALTEGAAVTLTPCMSPKCTAKLTEKDFEELALPSTLQRYMYFLLKEYSERELHCVFCPNPNCGNAVVYSGAGRPTDVVECHCGMRF